MQDLIRCTSCGQTHERCYLENPEHIGLCWPCRFELCSNPDTKLVTQPQPAVVTTR